MEKPDKVSVSDFKDGKDGDHTLRGTRSREISWLSTSASVSMLISLIYLISRAKFVLLAEKVDPVIWAVLLIEIATAGMNSFEQLSFRHIWLTRKQFPDCLHN